MAWSVGPALLGTLSSQFLDHSCIWGSILRQGLGMTAEESQGLRPLGRGRLKLASPSCAEREGSKGRVSYLARRASLRQWFLATRG